ncbi:MAG: DUF4381 domain-containing protein [Proteobacteria bacterium]|nr:DUF4381 domain-containing protein [Pseudomonadota bacterium]
MSAAGPQLRDIHLPPVPWWPPASGWWVLAGLLALACALGIAAWWRGRRGRALRQAARQELTVLAARHAQDHDDVALAAGLSHLLRRIALLSNPGVVAHDDARWRQFLRGVDRARTPFSEEQIELLTTAPYRPRASYDSAALLAATRRWCEDALGRRATLRGSP